jgi:hypothetical protein
MPAIARDRGEEPRTVIDDRDPLRVVVTGFGVRGLSLDGPSLSLTIPASPSCSTT